MEGVRGLGLGMLGGSRRFETCAGNQDDLMIGEFVCVEALLDRIKWCVIQKPRVRSQNTRVRIWSAGMVKIGLYATDIYNVFPGLDSCYLSNGMNSFGACCASSCAARAAISSSSAPPSICVALTAVKFAGILLIAPVCKRSNLAFTNCTIM